MVAWYDPGQLLSTGADVAISTIFGKEADFRMLEMFKAAANGPFRIQVEEGKPLWLDYAADTGDGWNSTYSVAYWLTKPELTVSTKNKSATVKTEPGRVLIFGGDEIYPTPSRANYEARLVAPFECARLKTTPPHPELYAIPGNHDWYDNLVSFTRLFCSKDWFAGWALRQKRSYFAVQLPYGWWLIGTDIQLGSDIDEDQVRYFCEVAAKMKPGDRVIVCTAEPHWIYAEAYRSVDPQYYSEKNLSFLESKIFFNKIQLFIAGDLHHYRRHEAEDRKQKIVAGGAGAFLHPTHVNNFDELTQDLLTSQADGTAAPQHTVYRKQASYPPEPTSFGLAFRNLLFPVLNPKFGVLTAVLYLLLAWSMPDLRQADSVGHALRLTINAKLPDPLATILVLAVIAGFVFFTDSHFRLFRWLGGGVHGLLHIAAAFFVGWGASALAVRWFDFNSTPYLLIAGVLILVGGWIAGSFIFGIYLLISINVFRRHGNEAFSSLQIEDYKNFLRMRIDPDGTLTIFPIGIDKVARQWKPGPAGGPSHVPDGSFTEPFLIEDPIRIVPK